MPFWFLFFRECFLVVKFVLLFELDSYHHRYEGNENIALGLVQVTAKRIVPLFAELCKKQ